MVAPDKEVVEKLKTDWKSLWKERINDQVRAEGVASTDYVSLFVERGTIVNATRDFKPLNFKEILERHEVDNPERFVPPNPHVGGWSKFIKTQITSQKRYRTKRADSYCPEKKEKQQPKKGGRGWLHK
jgi:hypothetical protein